LRKKIVSTTNSDAMSVSVSSSASDGTYSVKVEQLAKTHQIKSNGFNDKDYTKFGTGKITIKTGNNNSVDVNIDSSNNTLQGIANAINNSSTGVTATVIDNGGASQNYQLVITSKTSGKDGEIVISNQLEGGTSLEYSTLQAAQNSKIFIGDDASHITIEKSSNTITDAIPGVTMTLLETTTDYAQVKVSTDAQKSQTKIQGLLDNYNSLVDFFNNQFQHDGTTKKQGTLANNSTLMSIQSMIDRIMFGTSSNGGAFSNLTQLGITMDTEGKLSISDVTVFNDAVSANPDSIAKLFNDETGGIATKLDTYLNQILDGTIDDEEKMAQSSIDAIDESIESKNNYLTRLEQKYRLQFTELNTALAKLQTQMSSITASLSSLSTDYG